MAEMVGGDIQVGDYVQLTPRESPHRDELQWWWRVYNVTEYGLDVRHFANDGRCIAVRSGVDAARVVAIHPRTKRTKQ